jgi:hypothetical protein
MAMRQSVLLHERRWSVSIPLSSGILGPAETICSRLEHFFEDLFDR